MHQIRVVLCSLIGLVGLGACGQGWSELKVLGGKKDNKSHPAAVALLITFDDNQKINCTGTVVAKRKVLTAAHCLVSKNNKRAKNVKILNDLGVTEGKVDGSIASSDFQVKASFVADPEGLSSSQSMQRRSNDIGMVSFNKDLPYNAASIAKKATSKGDKVGLIGYGYSQVNGDTGEIKRTASVRKSAESQVSSVQDGVIVVSTDDLTKRGSIASGDSGGPLLNTRGEVVGVASGAGSGVKSDSGRFEYTGVFANIAESSNAEFIKSELGK